MPKVHIARGAAKEYDCLWSYSFKEGKKRSLILANVDVKKALPVVIKLPKAAKGQAVTWQLSGKGFLSHNELKKGEGPETPMQVVLKEGKIADFKSGYRLKVPAASIITIVWNEK